MSEQHIQNMIDGEIEKVAEAITNLRAIGGERAVGEALKMAGLPPNGDELLEALEGLLHASKNEDGTAIGFALLKDAEIVAAGALDKAEGPYDILIWPNGDRCFALYREELFPANDNNYRRVRPTSETYQQEWTIMNEMAGG